MKKQIKTILREVTFSGNPKALEKALNKRFAGRLYLEDNDTEMVEFRIENIHLSTSALGFFYIDIAITVLPESEVYDASIYDFDAGILKNTLGDELHYLDGVVRPYIEDDIHEFMRYTGLSEEDYEFTCSCTFGDILSNDGSPDSTKINEDMDYDKRMKRFKMMSEYFNKHMVKEYKLEVVNAWDIRYKITHFDFSTKGPLEPILHVAVYKKSTMVRAGVGGNKVVMTLEEWMRKRDDSLGKPIFESVLEWNISSHIGTFCERFFNETLHDIFFKFSLADF